jgi:hypothetical protein
MVLTHESRLPDVCLGSISTEIDWPRHVRFTPDSDLAADIAGGPARANFGVGTTRRGYEVCATSLKAAARLLVRCYFALQTRRVDRKACFSFCCFQHTQTFR